MFNSDSISYLPKPVTKSHGPVRLQQSPAPVNAGAHDPSQRLPAAADAGAHDPSQRSPGPAEAGAHDLSQRLPAPANSGAEGTHLKGPAAGCWKLLLLQRPLPSVRRRRRMLGKGLSGNKWPNNGSCTFIRRHIKVQDPLFGHL